MKNKKDIILLLILSIIFVAIVIFIYFFMIRDNLFVKKVSKVLNSGDPEKVVVTVNQEEITEKDINYKRLVNENINKELNLEENTDFESLKKEVIIDKLLLQEANKNDINLDEEEKELITTISKQLMNETDYKIAKEIGLTSDEYLQYSIEKQIETRVIEEMREKIIIDIVEGSIEIDDVEFNKIMKEITQITDSKQLYDILQEAYDRYIVYLIENSNIN